MGEWPMCYWGVLTRFVSVWVFGIFRRLGFEKGEGGLGCGFVVVGYRVRRGTYGFEWRWGWVGCL